MRQITDLDELIEGFNLYCLAERKAPKTIGWYIPKLVYLEQFLEENGLALAADEQSPHSLATVLGDCEVNVNCPDSLRDHSHPRR